MLTPYSLQSYIYIIKLLSIKYTSKSLLGLVTCKAICEYERTKTSINGDAIQYKFHDIETIDPKLFLKTFRKLVKYLIKKQNFDNVKYQLE